MKKIKLALLDNNDSFTYNIVDSLRQIENVSFKVFRTNETKIGQLNSFNKIIISPGPGLPKKFPTIFGVLKKYHTSKSILGICMGHQAIGEFFGAQLKRIYPVVHGQAQAVKIIKPSPLFSRLPDTFKAGLYHSWALASEEFSKELEINAVSENGEIMAISSQKYSVYGIQFHPESFITEHGLTILKNFAGLM